MDSAESILQKITVLIHSPGGWTQEKREKLGMLGKELRQTVATLTGRAALSEQANPSNTAASPSG